MKVKEEGLLKKTVLVFIVIPWAIFSAGYFRCFPWLSFVDVVAFALFNIIGLYMVVGFTQLNGFLEKFHLDDLAEPTKTIKISGKAKIFSCLCLTAMNLWIFMYIFTGGTEWHPLLKGLWRVPLLGYIFLFFYTPGCCEKNASKVMVISDDPIAHFDGHCHCYTVDNRTGAAVFQRGIKTD